MTTPPVLVFEALILSHKQLPWGNITQIRATDHGRVVEMPDMRGMGFSPGDVVEIKITQKKPAEKKKA